MLKFSRVRMTDWVILDCIDQGLGLTGTAVAFGGGDPNRYSSFTVIQMLRRLERELGFEVYVRTQPRSRPVRAKLTPKGKEALEIMRPAVDVWHKLAESLK